MDLDESGEFVDFKSEALQAITFILVTSDEDLDNPNASNSFPPEMAHQVFGESEAIFGYAGLKVHLYYHHNSSKCLLEIKYAKKIGIAEVDDLPKMLNEYLPRNFLTDKEEFKRLIKKEESDRMFGTVIHEFKRQTDVAGGKTRECTYKITQMDTSDPVFQEYHERFETFIIWYIDAANFIDLKDERWMIFYIYEEYTIPKTGKKIVTPIGFTAIYKFFCYPDSNRARISQFFILPSHQQKGLGSVFYQTVYQKILKDMPNVSDITVEEPSEVFQKMRDYCDCIRVYEDLEANGGTLETKNNKNLYLYFSKHKISKRQALRITDILTFVKALQNGTKAQTAFEQTVYQRMKKLKLNEAQCTKVARSYNRDRSTAEVLDEECLKRDARVYIDQIEPIAQKILNTIDS